MITRLTISWPSLALLRPVELAVGLPPFFSLAKTPFKCIWALHCAMESANFFFDRLDGASLVERQKVAIIAPSLGNGYFINSEFEVQADFLDELARQLPQILPISTKKEDNSVIGVSMGGFGAIRWALAGGNFGHAAAISGVFDCHVAEDEKIYSDRELKAIHLSFKKIMARYLLNPAGSTRDEANLGSLAQKAGTDTFIKLYCGEQDYISLNQTRWLKALLDRMSIPATLTLLPGAHNSEFWKKAFHLAAKNILEPGRSHAAH